MKRTIVAFHQDDESHWVADLSCGHSQHMRHKPPLSRREWVLTEEGRAERIGTELECVLCDEREIPTGAKLVKRTEEFSTRNLPEALGRKHRTSNGMWGRITVLEGTVRYLVFGAAEREELLTPERSGVIVPEVEHCVRLEEGTRFFIEFFR